MSADIEAWAPVSHSSVTIGGLPRQAHVLVVSAIDAEEVVPRIREMVGIDLPVAPGVAQEPAHAAAFWLSPRSWLLRLPEADAAPTIAAIGAAFPDRVVHATPYSDALYWFELSGSGAVALLARGGHLSLSTDGFQTGHFKRTVIADISLLVWRRAPTVWEVACERSRQRYFEDWLANSIAISAEGGTP